MIWPPSVITIDAVFILVEFDQKNSTTSNDWLTSHHIERKNPEKWSIYNFFCVFIQTHRVFLLHQWPTWFLERRNLKMFLYYNGYFLHKDSPKDKQPDLQVKLRIVWFYKRLLKQHISSRGLRWRAKTFEPRIIALMQSRWIPGTLASS